MSPRISIRLLARQSDRRLLELVGHGDERAFETVVARYRPALIRYCRRLGLDEPAAEDVAQHSFTKAWLALSGGEQVKDLRPWLYRIAHNDALNARRAAVRLTQLSDAQAAGERAVTRASIESSMQAREALGHVAALPDMQRDAVVLTAIQGRSHEEAADALGISDGAVRGLLYRARATLRSAAAAIAPPWLLQRLPGLAPAASVAGDAPAAGGALGLGVAATKLWALAAGAGLLAAGVAGVAGHAHPRAHPARHRTGAGAQVAEGASARPAAVSLLASAAGAATHDGSRAPGTGAGLDRHRGPGHRSVDGPTRGRHERRLSPARLEDAFRGMPTIGSGGRNGGGGSGDRTDGGALFGSTSDGSSPAGGSTGDGGAGGGGFSDGGSNATLESSQQDGGSSGAGSGESGTQTGALGGDGSGASGTTGTSGGSTDGGGGSSTDGGSGTSGGE